VGNAKGVELEKRTKRAKDIAGFAQENTAHVAMVEGKVDLSHVVHEGTHALQPSVKTTPFVEREAWLNQYYFLLEIDAEMFPTTNDLRKWVDAVSRSK